MKIYVNVIVETGKLCNTYEVFDTFEKAKKKIFDTKPSNRNIEETELKNRFKISDEKGNHVHTIEIVDLWVH